MVINYNFDKAKQNVISLVKQYSYDFCSDMLKEIKQAADNGDIDTVEDFVKTIRKAEQVAEEQVRQIEEAHTIADILMATSGNELSGNVLYECDTDVLKAIFGHKFVKVIFDNNELPF
jgi:LPS O-antigen subunit length determinant protein (WzzB/FepE family)